MKAYVYNEIGICLGKFDIDQAIKMVADHDWTLHILEPSGI